MDIVKEILIVLLSSTVVSGIFLFFLKNYIAKMLGLEFDKRKVKLDLQAKKAGMMDDILLNDQTAIYPQLITLCSRICSIMEEGGSKEFAYQWEPSFRPLCAQLTEDLYKHRYYLPPDIYDIFHKIKRIIQDTALRIDVYTREENVFDKNTFPEQLKKIRENTDQAKKHLKEAHKRISQENEKVRSLK